MKYSFLTYLFCRYPLEYSFRMAAEYGFDGVEIWGARPHGYAYDMDDAALGAIRTWKADYGVEVSMYTPEILAYPYNLASPSAKERKETLDYLSAALEAAAGMETKRMLVTIPHPGFLTDFESAWKWAVDGLGQLCRRAEALGVRVVLESLSPSESSLITTADDARRMLRDVGNSALCAMLDLVPPAIANEPFSLYLEPADLDVDYLHITNTDAKTEFHAAFDEGVLPMQAVFRVLKRCGFDGWCSLELLNPYFKDPELYLADSIGKMRNWCEEVQ